MIYRFVLFRDSPKYRDGPCNTPSRASQAPSAPPRGACPALELISSLVPHVTSYTYPIIAELSSRRKVYAVGLRRKPTQYTIFVSSSPIFIRLDHTCTHLPPCTRAPPTKPQLDPHPPLATRASSSPLSTRPVCINNPFPPSGPPH